MCGLVSWLCPGRGHAETQRPMVRAVGGASTEKESLELGVEGQSDSSADTVEQAVPDEEAAWLEALRSETAGPCSGRAAGPVWLAPEEGLSAHRTPCRGDPAAAPSDCKDDGPGALGPNPGAAGGCAGGRARHSAELNCLRLSSCRCRNQTKPKAPSLGCTPDPLFWPGAETSAIRDLGG